MKKIIFSILYLFSLCMWFSVNDVSDIWAAVIGIVLAFCSLFIVLRNLKEVLIITLVIVVASSFVVVPAILPKNIVFVEAKVTDIQRDSDPDMILDVDTYVSYSYNNIYYENIHYSGDTDARYEIGDTIYIEIDSNNPSKVVQTSTFAVLFLAFAYIGTYLYAIFETKYSYLQ